MNDIPIQALNREARLSDRVTGRLEELIMSGALATGQRLPVERELAGMFGVSRTVIREAVGNLAARGLLEAREGGGTFVCAPSAGAVAESLNLLLRFTGGGILLDDFQHIRRVLEVAAARRAAERATAEDIADLEGILRRLEEADTDSATHADLDVEFHRAVAVATHNPLFIILMDSIGELLIGLRRFGLKDPLVRERARHRHREILDGVASRDPLKAEEAMSAHLDHAQNVFRRVLTTGGHEQSLFRLEAGSPENPTESLP